jgi:ABC-type multidrug transport system fused ATPase/permease subunit
MGNDHRFHNPPNLAVMGAIILFSRRYGLPYNTRAYRTACGNYHGGNRCSFLLIFTGQKKEKMVAMKLSASNISFSYGHIKALNNVSVEINAGEIVSIIGPNGAGKSTLLKCINGILKSRTGEVKLDGLNINHTGTRMLARNMGYVPQSNAEVFPYTVFEIVLMGRKPYNR